jgi:RND superfamily putative drug exporter
LAEQLWHDRVVRWPRSILVATLAVALVGLVTLPNYKTSYNDGLYTPKNIPADLGLCGR